MILGKETLEECKVREVKISEVDIETEVALGATILEKVEVGLEKGSIQVTLGGMIEAAVD